MRRIVIVSGKVPFTHLAWKGNRYSYYRIDRIQFAFRYY